MSEREPTPAQAIEVERLRELLIGEGREVCVHWNECGCCVSVHELVDPVRFGFVVGSDGTSDRYEIGYEEGSA